MSITPETVFADVHTLADAKEIVADIRATAIAVEKARGADHSTTKIFWDRYWGYVDEMAFKFGKVHKAA